MLCVGLKTLWVLQNVILTVQNCALAACASLLHLTRHSIHEVTTNDVDDTVALELEMSMYVFNTITDVTPVTNWKLARKRMAKLAPVAAL